MYLAVFVGSGVVGIAAAAVFTCVELRRRPSRLTGSSIAVWALLLLLAFFGTGSCLAAVAVFQFPVAAGFFICLATMSLLLWAMVFFTSSTHRRRRVVDTPDDGVQLVGRRPTLTVARQSRKRACLTIGKTRPAAFFGSLAAALLWSTACIWLKDLCVASSPEMVSVWLSRYSLPASQRCDAYNDGSPCHVYFTLSDTPDTFIANFHHRVSRIDSTAVPKARWSYDDGGGGQTTTASGFVYQYQDIPYRSETQFRAVSWAYLGPLLPGRTIAVSVSLDGIVWSKSYRLRTLPPTDAGLRCVVGGDSGLANLTQLLRLGAASEPHFAVHGGDVAYENAMVNCVSRWDQWLYDWEHNMTTPQGFSVPLTLAIGNHEAGGFNKAAKDSPYFRMFFAQEPGLADVASRKTFHVHRITPTTTVFALDSAVIASHESQVPWLRAEMTRVAGPHKWAVYHAPLFPSVRPMSTPESALGRQHWEPVFDSLGLEIGFENHEHGLKRSKRIVGSLPVSPGTAGPVYLGDGCWGAAPRPARPDSEGLFDVVKMTQYVLVGARNQNDTAWEFRALGPAGTLLDQFQV